ncbi:f-box domain-containing protein [Gigaspora margarita]|uniref:F-box domain-containing protein n=1 Tax=Gigaspora margarita TaxID=4874 RepID=A0A8H4AXH8_GIGMA|nr:f-box domain-containing protein [Gigaspora margarita]
MITLPNECYYEIFNNLCHDYKNLFSCALVNRQWCRIIIPILWRKPNLKDIRVIRIFLLTLNENELAPLIPFKINFPNHPKPLFEYTNYITSINNSLHDGVMNWLVYEGFKMHAAPDVESSLIAMILRTSENLKSLIINEIICNQLVFENLYENTTVLSISLCKIRDDYKSKRK